MAYYSEQLKLLKNQICEKQRNESILKDLRRQHTEMTEQIERLEEEMQSEQADVERLQGFTLAALIAKISGSHAQKLSKEQREAHVAAAKYNVAVKQLSEIEGDIFEYDKRLRDFRDVEKQYEQLFNEKLSAVKASQLPQAEEILLLEGKVHSLELRLKEINEAITAGKNAQSICDNMVSSLGKAENWGTFDLIGGGTVAAVVKHSHLDTAQGQIEHLQSALRRFRSELADIEIDVEANIQVNIDGFLRFADFFFDGIAADYMVLDKIADSKSQVKGMATKINTVMNKLNALKTSTERECINTRGRIRTLVSEAQL